MNGETIELVRGDVGKLEPQERKLLAYFGWTGNSNKSGKALMNEIMKMKDGSFVKGAEFIVKRDRTDFYTTEPDRVQLSRAYFPFGKCLEFKKKVSKGSIINFDLVLNSSTRMDKGYNKYRIVLRDPSTKFPIFPLPLEFRTPEILIDHHRPNSIFKIQVYKTVHEETDRSLECTNYKKNFTYEDCVYDEFTKEIRKNLQCSPPWLADENSTMCEGILNISEEVVIRCKMLMDSVIRRAKISGCKRDCEMIGYKSSYAFEAEDDGDNQEGILYSIRLEFEETMTVTSSVFSIGGLTFLTRIGGNIGFGRTVFWLFMATLALFKIHLNFRYLS